MRQNSLPEKKKSIALPDELWTNLLKTLPAAARGVETSIRLSSGEIVQRLVISDRGRIIGREAAGLAGYHGAIDNSMLTFGAEDVEAVQVPAFHLWQRPKWVELNFQHSTRPITKENKCVEHLEGEVEIPDEIWFTLLRIRLCPTFGFYCRVKLFDGRLLERLVVNNRGTLIGKLASGFAGAQGDIDASVLNFTTNDIEAIEVPAFHFWQRPKWIALNPQHPTRRMWQQQKGGSR